MALNITFTGDIYDENDVALQNVTYRGYHLESNVWSGAKVNTTETQYNFNLGDGDWLTQTGNATSGDTVMVIFETDEASVTDRRFAVYEFTLTSSQVYVQDIQLRPVQPAIALGLWNLNSPTDGSGGSNTFANSADSNATTYIGRLNEIISVQENFTDDFSWSFDPVGIGGNGSTITLRHTATGPLTSEDTTFGDRVGITVTEYDWTEDDSFVATANNSYSLLSDDPNVANSGTESYEVEVRLTNIKGDVTTDTLRLQIRRNAPVPDLTFSEPSPDVTDNGTFSVTGAVTDVDGGVTNIEYVFDGNVEANNTNLTYNFTPTLPAQYQATIAAEANITWNDGFTGGLTIPYSENVSMTNLPPSFSLTSAVIGSVEDNTLEFSINSGSDPDGVDADLDYKFVIEYTVPFSAATVEVFNGSYADYISDPETAQFTFVASGDYRITAYLRDGSGLVTTAFEDVTFASASGLTGEGQIKLNNNVWQLISIPVKGKNINDYFLAEVETRLNALATTAGHGQAGSLTAADAIEVVNAYPGDLNSFLSFIPGVTNPASANNFNLVRNDGVNVDEVAGFWVKMKNYHQYTNSVDIIFDWDMTE
jgi:hypothetical protein